ncbi:MAG: hypothetical protein ACLFUS_02765 [Candidatus Sumerlaeia bacterium]
MQIDEVNGVINSIWGALSKGKSLDNDYKSRNNDICFGLHGLDSSHGLINAAGDFTGA